MATRKDHERAAAPVLASALGPNERILVAGFGMLHAGKKTFALENIKHATKMRLFWVALTDERVALVGMSAFGKKPVLERVEPRSRVHVLEHRTGVTQDVLALSAGGVEYPLRFGWAERKTARALAAMLGR